jgi:hypothetical protein
MLNPKVLKKRLFKGVIPLGRVVEVCSCDVVDVNLGVEVTPPSSPPPPP